jgi:hypothetical protein
MRFKVTTNLDAYKADMVATLERLGKTLPWLKRTGNRVAMQARKNARAKPSRPGGTGFWRKLAKTVNLDSVSATAVSVHTNHVAAAQKEFGGPIVAKNARALTIPIADEAKGKRASEFEQGGRDLFVIPSDAAGSLGILGYSTGDDDFHALFALRKRTRPQAPNPFWPPNWQVADFMLQEGDRFVLQAIQEQ